jgi:uncharacterized protein (TIGR00251 family)
MPDFYQWDNKSRLTLFCHLQPKASKDEFAGQYGERLKIRITAPPIDGKANTQLIKFIAKQFGVAKAQVTISSGESSRHKTLNIENPQRRPEGLGILPDPGSGQ